MSRYVPLIMAHRHRQYAFFLNGKCQQRLLRLWSLVQIQPLPAFISEARNRKVGIRGRSKCHDFAPGPARWCRRKRGRFRLPYVDLCQFRQSYVI